MLGFLSVLLTFVVLECKKNRFSFFFFFSPSLSHYAYHFEMKARKFFFIYINSLFFWGGACCFPFATGITLAKKKSSQGDHITFGSKEAGDIRCVIQYLFESNSVSCIILWGHGMGAAATMVATCSLPCVQSTRVVHLPPTGSLSECFKYTPQRYRNQ